MSAIIEFLKVLGPLLRSGRMSYSDALTRFRAQFARPAEGMEKTVIMKEIEKAPSNVVQFPSGGIHNVPVNQQFTRPGSRQLFEVLDDDAYRGLQADTFRRLIANTDDDVKAFGKRIIENKQDVKFEKLTKDQRKGIFDMIDDRLKMGNRKFMEKYDSKFPPPEDFASGGIARVGYAGGKIVKGASWVIKNLRKSRQEVIEGKGQFSKLNPMEQESLKWELSALIKQLERGGKIPDDMLQTMRQDKRFKDIVKTPSTDPELRELEEVLLDHRKQELLDDWEGEAWDSGRDVVDSLTGPKEIKKRKQIEMLKDFDTTGRKKNASGGIARVGMKFGGFSKLEVLINILTNTIKGSKDPYVKKNFPNWIKELKKNPSLANNENVWRELTSHIGKDKAVKNQRLIVHSDDSVDFFTQSEFGPHNIEKTLEFQKKHNLSRDQANKILRMEPEDRVLEMKRLETIRNKTMQAEGGIAGQLHLNRPGYGGGKLVLDTLLKLLKGAGKKKDLRGVTGLYKHIDMEKLMKGKEPITVYSGSMKRPSNTWKSFQETAKDLGTTPEIIAKDKFKDQWFTPFKGYADMFSSPKSLESKLRSVDLTPKEIAIAKRYVEKINKKHTLASMRKKLGIDKGPLHHVTTDENLVLIPRYKLKELEKSGRMKTDYMILEKLKKKLGLAKGGLAHVLGV